MWADAQRCCSDYVYTSAGELAHEIRNSGEDKPARKPLLWLALLLSGAMSGHRQRGRGWGAEEG